MTTGTTELHTFGILLADKKVASSSKLLNNVVVVRIGISRTYDDIVNDVMRKLKYDPYIYIWPSEYEVFSNTFSSLWAEIIDRFSTTDDENATNIGYDVDYQRIVSRSTIGRGGYNDSVPGVLIKTVPSGDRTA